METVVLIQFGSHMYGTNVATSDLDYKSIFIPRAEDILLQRVRHNISTTTKAAKDSKNSADDVDTESFALHEWELVASFQEWRRAARWPWWTPSAADGSDAVRKMCGTLRQNVGRHARDRCMFYPHASEVCLPYKHAFSPYTSRGSEDC